MPYETFLLLLEKLRGQATYLYFHLMGEPLLHPCLPEMIRAARDAGFFVMITTNGTLLQEKGAVLYEGGGVKKVSVSLQALESGQIPDGEAYLRKVAQFAKNCAENNVMCVLRLWNLGSEAEAINEPVLALLHRLFPDPWIPNRSGYKLIAAPRGEKEVYLEFGQRFDWPDERKGNSHPEVTSCRALTHQVGILWDGRVVPCCMDADGRLALGNLLEDSLERILSSPRAAALRASFDRRRPTEPLCLTCGYAYRFQK